VRKTVLCATAVVLAMAMGACHRRPANPDATSGADSSAPIASDAASSDLPSSSAIAASTGAGGAATTTTPPPTDGNSPTNGQPH
jgi:hypothetical protein